MPYKDPERRRAYGREWMKRNPEKARESMSRWRAAHPEVKKSRAREYDVLDRERIITKVTAYLRAHPGKALAHRQTRRAREIGAVGRSSDREWLALVEQHGGLCAYCGASGPLHADHRTPLFRGGANDISNILPACRVCDQRKYTMTEQEFRELLSREAAAGGDVGVQRPSPPRQ